MNAARPVVTDCHQTHRPIGMFSSNEASPPGPEAGHLAGFYTSEMSATQVALAYKQRAEQAEKSLAEVSGKLDASIKALAVQTRRTSDAEEKLRCELLSLTEDDVVALSYPLYKEYVRLCKTFNLKPHMGQACDHVGVVDAQEPSSDHEA